MKKVMPLIAIVSALIVSQNVSAGNGCVGDLCIAAPSDAKLESAYTPAQVVVDVVEVVADELLNLK